MSFSYDSTALDVTLNRIRLAIGDTKSIRPLLDDDEITQILSEESLFNMQVARCCRLIASLFANKPERFQIEKFSETQGEIYNRYVAMADRHEAITGGAPWAGSIDVAFKDATILDTSLITPMFSRDQFKNKTA